MWNILIKTGIDNSNENWGVDYLEGLLTNVMSSVTLAQPFLAAIALLLVLLVIGDRGSKVSLKRNNPCMAALCIFLFALGTGQTIWFLLMKPIFAIFGATFALSYPLIMMYWAFWLFIGVLITAKKLVYDTRRRQEYL